MIKYEWRTELSPPEADELAGLLARAAAYDAEAGHNTIDFADVAQSLATEDSPDRHLLIWMLPHATAMDEPNAPECIAGLLRLTGAAGGSAEAAAVIDPGLRSIGIMTLLLEQVGLVTSGPDGWLESGAHTITAWARGNHPASGRLSDRFLIPRTRRVWQLIRGTESESDLAAPVLEPSGSTAGGPRYALREAGRVVGTVALSRQPVQSEEFGDCAVVDFIDAAPSAPPGALRRLLDGAVAVAAEVGLSGAVIHVDSGDTRIVNAARLAGFHHDRTDVRYQLGGSS
ncbi:acetyltransferase [Mycolicibacterium rhodesiae JS60]|nr:acetyltransferase [Mycolicibacterium rhodesiae JS60]